MWGDAGGSGRWEHPDADGVELTGLGGQVLNKAVEAYYREEEVHQQVPPSRSHTLQRRHAGVWTLTWAAVCCSARSLTPNLDARSLSQFGETRTPRLCGEEQVARQRERAPLTGDSGAVRCARCCAACVRGVRLFSRWGKAEPGAQAADA
eukprot:2250622-Rhodomonas_salina.2